MVDLTAENIEQIASAVKDKFEETSDPASLLGTVSDIWVLIALIIPGFIMLTIIKWFIKDDFKPDKFLLTLYSLIGSIGLIIILSQLGIDGVEISSIDQIRHHSANIFVIGILFSLSIGIGIAGGLFLRYTIYRNKFAGSAWDQFVKLNAGKYVKIYAEYNDKLTILSGYIKTASTGNDEKKELTLGSPAVWENNSWRFLEEAKENEDKIVEIYLPEESIKRMEKLTI